MSEENRAALQDRIKAQGDVVRKLKEEKATKEKVRHHSDQNIISIN